MFDYYYSTYWSFLTDNQATCCPGSRIPYSALLQLCTNSLYIPSNQHNHYKNLWKSSRKSFSFSSALPSSPTSLSQPKTPYPYPSIAVPVLDMKESSGVKSSAESKTGSGGSSCSGLTAVWGSGWLVLEMGGYDPLRSKSRTRDATLPVLRVPASGVACAGAVDSFLIA